MILFIGIPASGKSTFYQENFFHSHVRVNLDMLRTRNRENRLLDFCFKTMQRLVVDNTNVTVKDRQKYIALAKQFRFEVKGFYFRSDIVDCMTRNALRTHQQRVPDKGMFGKYHALQLPHLDEGFDELYDVRIQDDEFIVLPWQNEIR